MEEYFIQWEEQDLEKLSEQDKSHLFLIVAGRKAIYIGFAFELNLKEEIHNTLQNLDINESDALFWSVSIVENIHTTINRQVAEECMCLLVFEHQSVLNSICLNEFHGRDTLKINNRGCPLLKESISADTPHIKMVG